MAKSRAFSGDDPGPACDVYRGLFGGRSVIEKLSHARRAVEIERRSDPSGPSASISLSDQGVNVIVSPLGYDPGQELTPVLAERGVQAPGDWRLMVDVGSAVGWVAPRDADPETVVGHAVAVLEELNDPPLDGWKAYLESRSRRRFTQRW